MNYDFLISGIRIRCAIPYEITVTRESAPFLVASSDVQADVMVEFVPVESLPVPDGGFALGNTYHLQSDCEEYIYHYLADPANPFACLSYSTDAPQSMLCRYLPDSQRLITCTQNIMNLLGLETLLLQHEVLLLHSAFISVADCGILFTAPSGTGKSTQADLWAKYAGADIINGDRAAMRRENGVWTAWGLPYAGTSGIYRNESAPIHAIVVLRQSKVNSVRRLGPAEAIRFIYPELTLHRWETASVDKSVDLLTDLVMGVPVYLLECLPDEDAVLTLKRMLNESGEVFV